MGLAWVPNTSGNQCLSVLHVDGTLRIWDVQRKQLLLRHSLLVDAGENIPVGLRLASKALPGMSLYLTALHARAQRLHLILLPDTLQHSYFRFLGIANCLTSTIASLLYQS